MNLNKLAKIISQKEGLKKQVNIAQIKEILSILSDMAWETLGMDDSPLETLVKNGSRRAKRKKK